jgi:hypothetical protein
MTARESIGLADLELLTLRITEGLVSPRPGCRLEVSTYVWHRNSFEAQHRFEEECEARRNRVRGEGPNRRHRMGMRVRDRRDRC